MNYNLIPLERTQNITRNSDFHNIEKRDSILHYANQAARAARN